MTDPQTFRKKPVTIQAMQLTPENRGQIIKWGAASTQLGRVIPAVQPADDSAQLLIHTLEGTMRAEWGDWIVRGVQGEFYPVKPDIFTVTYEATTDV
ncbi:hypothetical protein ACN95_14500 [Gordonia sihwensis]|uniref:hypothetical protein n=1 Tax=Gordonia sihwensis TaxID=173559 RepID=UPI001C93199F|nr:hypothetical protein [Gordonia sihwensis]MBY4571227.1 hypothetical protein [Gordonia sihwensis]